MSYPIETMYNNHAYGSFPSMTPSNTDAELFKGELPTNTSRYGQGSLHIRNLDKSVVEADLYTTFSAFGSIHSVRVCTDNVTHESLGYGYVNFHRQEEAMRVLESHPAGIMIGGGNAILMLSQRHNARKSSKDNHNTVFVNQIDPMATEEELGAVFAQFGLITLARIATNKDNTSKGYGFVSFESVPSAKMAIESSEKILLREQPLFVAPYRPKHGNHHRGGSVSGSSTNDYSDDWTNCYIKNMPLSWDENRVREVFEVYGPITSFVIMKDDEGNSKGFGFVNFVNHADASRACDALTGTFDDESAETKGEALRMVVTKAQRKKEKSQGHHHGGRRSNSYSDRYDARERSVSRSERYAGLNVYIRNLDDSVDDTLLVEAFQQFGTILSAVVMRREDGASRNFGFVCFASTDEADNAVATMNNTAFHGKTLHVSLALQKSSSSHSNRRPSMSSQSSNGSYGMDNGDMRYASNMGGMTHYNMTGGAPHHPAMLPPYMMPAHHMNGYGSPMLSPMHHGGMPAPSMYMPPTTSLPPPASVRTPAAHMPSGDVAQMRMVYDRLHSLLVERVPTEAVNTVINFFISSFHMSFLAQLINNSDMFNAKLPEVLAKMNLTSRTTPSSHGPSIVGEMEASAVVATESLPVETAENVLPVDTAAISTEGEVSE